MVWFVVPCVIGAVLLALRVSAWPESLFFFPSRDAFETPPGFQDVSFTTRDGLVLHGWLGLPPGASAERPVPAVLHVHGNAGNVASHAAFSEFLVMTGIAVFVFDYRSYGRSDPGRLTRQNLMNDTRDAWEYLKRRPEVDPARLAVYGVSIGCTFGAALAAEAPEARCLVLAAPFASWARIAHEHCPVLGPVLIGGGPNPVESVRALGARPLLVVHDSGDEIVPISHGRMVVGSAAAAGVHAELAVVSGAGHNGLIADDTAGRNAVLGFLDLYLRTAGRP